MRALFCAVFQHYLFDNVVFWTQKFSFNTKKNLEDLHRMYTDLFVENTLLFYLEKNMNFFVALD